MAVGDATTMQHLSEQDALHLRQQEEAAQRSYEAALVSPLDADFLLVLCLAMMTDALDIVLEIFAFLIFPKALGIVIDILALGIVFWIKWRTDQVIDRKTHRETMKSQYSEKLRGAAGRRGSAMASARTPLRRFWLRMSFVFLLELIPFVGIIPFWTITVLGVLRQR
ncbi:MAG TPA: hypothetical protein VFE94_01535 [Candidatus Paceibacterota bacterium]|nr:hypothetical protein [Candidatus Paceibacterota bacterium]